MFSYAEELAQRAQGICILLCAGRAVPIDRAVCATKFLAKLAKIARRAERVCPACSLGEGDSRGNPPFQSWGIHLTSRFEDLGFANLSEGKCSSGPAWACTLYVLSLCLSPTCKRHTLSFPSGSPDGNSSPWTIVYVQTHKSAVLLSDFSSLQGAEGSREAPSG